MNKNITEIAFILDRSGSMDSCSQEAIAGFNHFLKEQQQVEGLARLTLVLFDNEYLVPVQSLPVQEVLPLNKRTFLPRGSTALLDAIGKTIDDLGSRLGELPEADRPGQVIVTIFTDGMENSSVHFDWREISQKIKHQTEVYRWLFLFLGANQDAIATAAQLSISSANSSSYSADGVGTRTTHSAISRKLKGLRKVSQGSATLQEMADAKSDLSCIVKEEDCKERQ